jgi:putative NADPH-quinone reductase
MARKVLVINGHPDPRKERFCAALCAAYVKGAATRGHEIRRLDVGALDFALVRTADDFAMAEPPAAIRKAQADVAWADHLVVIHPLWLGGTPALLKGFFEQVFRYGFALSTERAMKGLLKGKSARVIVTMGMPAPVFRWVFGAHGLMALERGIFWISGMGPIRHTILGSVETGPRARWLETVEGLGWKGV